MFRHLLALVIATNASVAFALGSDSRSTDYANASTSEQAEWVSRVIELANRRQDHKFTRVEVASCLASLLKRPVPASVSAISLGEATAGCLSILKNQR